MPRTTKPLDERKGELIDTAERLFSAKGYEATAVSDAESPVTADAAIRVGRGRWRAKTGGVIRHPR